MQVDDRWTDRPAVIPKFKADGTLYLKDNRGEKFRVSWYEGKAKQWLGLVDASNQSLESILPRQQIKQA